MTERKASDKASDNAGDDEGDPRVARAIRTLPAPEHDPTFWGDLDRRLDAVDGERGATAAAAAPTDDPPDRRTATADLPAVVDLRRRPDRRLLGVAATLLLVVAVTAGLLTRPGSDDDDVEVADASTTTTAAPRTTATPEATTPATTSSTAPPTTPPSPTPTTAAAPAEPTEPTSAADAVETFVAALAAGDGDQAEALLGDESLAYLVRIDSTVDDLVESTYAAWGRPEVPDRSTSDQVLFSGDNGTLSIVQLVGNIGDVDGGPPDGEFVTVFPVFFDPIDDTYRIEIYPRGFEITGLKPDIVEPASDENGLQPIVVGTPIRFQAGDADRAFVSIDGGDLVEAEKVDGAFVFDPGPLTPGPTHLAVVTEGDQGIAYTAGATEIVAN